MPALACGRCCVSLQSPLHPSLMAKQLCLHGTGPAFSFGAVALIGCGHGLICGDVGLCQLVWAVPLATGEMEGKRKSPL